MRIRFFIVLTIAITSVACQADASSDASKSLTPASASDSVDAVNAALTHQGVGADRAAWVVVDYFRERDGYLLRLVNTTPNMIDGTFLAWVSNSKEVIILSVF